MIKASSNEMARSTHAPWVCAKSSRYSMSRVSTMPTRRRDLGWKALRSEQRADWRSGRELLARRDGAPAPSFLLAAVARSTGLARRFAEDARDLSLTRYPAPRPQIREGGRTRTDDPPQVGNLRRLPAQLRNHRRTRPGYVLVALTHHPRGDDYLEDLAREVDDVMTRR